MTPWEQEQARRRALIQQIYYQELGRDASQIDAAGMQYWMQQAHDLNNDDKLRDAIRTAGGGKAPAPQTTADLSNDPAYAAYLRQMAFDESTIQSNLSSAKARALQSIESQSPLFDQQRDQAGTNVDNRFESRGMFRSGARLAKRAESRGAIDVNQRRFEENQHSAIADAERSAAGDMAQIQRNRAEQEIAARNRLTQSSVR